MDAYHLRAPYPTELAATLLDLDSGPSGPILELGCGTAEIARALARHTSRVDAVDVSPAMLARARTLPGGARPTLRWIEATAEHFRYAGPYSLAVVGDALHWMEWDTVLPAIGGALAPGALLVLVTARQAPAPWDHELRSLIAEFSVMRNFEPYDLVAELQSRALFTPLGERSVGPHHFERSIEDYVESLHASAGLARDRMAPSRAAEFDASVRHLVEAHAPDGVLTLESHADLTWGTPHSAPAPS